jgi:hypothetical protein
MTEEINPQMVGDWPICGKSECEQYHRSGHEQYDPSFCTITGKTPRGECLPWYRHEVERLREKITSVPDQYSDIFEYNDAIREELFELEDSFENMVDVRLRAELAKRESEGSDGG